MPEWCLNMDLQTVNRNPGAQLLYSSKTQPDTLNPKHVALIFFKNAT